jgi:hypothetical protein
LEIIEFMRQLNPKQIVEWFRNQAKQFNKMADTVEATFKVQTRGRQVEEIQISDDEAKIILPENGTVTAHQFEDAVRKGHGRLNHFADRLNTTEETLRGLLSPASNVYVASAGWLRVKE